MRVLEDFDTPKPDRICPECGELTYYWRIEPFIDRHGLPNRIASWYCRRPECKESVESSWRRMAGRKFVD
jgi:hypothetical protein